VRELATLGVPVVADIGSGLIDASCPWLSGPPPAWLAGEPAARQTIADGAAIVTFSGDKLFGGPQAGVIAGRADLVERCRRHPLARALRPGGLVLAALQDTAMAYLDKRAADDIAFWRMVAVPLSSLRSRAGEAVAASVSGAHPSAVAAPTESLPGAGSAPGVTMPSYGVRIDGDLLALPTSSRPPGDRPFPRRPDDARSAIGRSVGRRDDHRCARCAPNSVVTVVATAGHVDHGKSSLVLALTGTDPDRFEEEKRRGLTIDLGFAHTTLPSGEELSFIDVPGHVKFLRNMLAGVGGVSACVFVVAATEGWKPQSEEHLRILELLGVDAGIIALTKADLVDDDLLELARMDVADHVAGTFLSGSPVIAVSATTGSGLDELRQELDVLVATPPEPPTAGALGLWIDRVFAAKGSGTVVTGTLTGGRLRVDQNLVVGDRPVRIRGLQAAGRSVGDIGPGNRVAVNLAGVDHHDLARGDALVAAAQWWPTDRFDASVHVLGALDHDVSRRGAFVAYIGSGEHAVRLRVLGAEALAPGADGAVRIFLPASLPLLPGDRFVLRESGRDETVGGGEVLDIEPVLRASRAAPDRTIERVVRERGWVTVDDVERLTGQRVEPTVGGG
jgi:selenocysteine-specific translation elongation factor